MQIKSVGNIFKLPPPPRGEYGSACIDFLYSPFEVGGKPLFYISLKSELHFWTTLILLFLVPLFNFAQTYLHINTSSNDQEILNQINYPTYFQNQDSIDNTLNNLLQDLQQKGYYAASIDTTYFQDSTFTAALYVGDLYNQFQIQNGNIPKDIWNKARLNIYENKALTVQQVEALKESLLVYSENNGHPFAVVRLDDIQIIKKVIKAHLFWETGPLITIGALKIEGKQQVISTTYLQNYLDIQSGTLFNKEKIEEATLKLQELPFLQSTRNPTALFEDDKADLYFFLEPQKANRFDFLIGVLPNNQETGKVLLTADIDAAFYNQFGKGEQFSIQFEQLRPETQQLNIAFNLPYLLNTPLGIDVDFGLYKRDTTYRDLNWRVGVQYQFSSSQHLTAFTQSLTTTLLSLDQNQIIEQQQLPPNLDTRYTAFGLAYLFEKLDYRLNPRKGWTLSFQGSAGFKNILVNENIATLLNPSNPTESLYDDLQQKSFQYRLEGELSTYFPIQQRSTVLFKLTGSTIIAEQILFNNEKYRIGGARLLRGFDEQSIFTDAYALGTLEYRYLIGKRSYFNVFSDNAWVRNEQINNWLLGLGAGMAFETKAGIFEISYALGKTDQTPFDFKAAKIHFGFINEF